MDAASGRLTDSPHVGYVVVAHQPDDSMRKASPRPLMIFLPDKDGHYRLAARNDAVIMKADEGGMGDPYLDGVAENALTVEPRTFTVEQGVSRAMTTGATVSRFATTTRIARGCSIARCSGTGASTTIRTAMR